MSGEWISVKDHLPKDRQDVLTYWPKRDLVQLQTFHKDYLNDGDDWWMHGWQSLRVQDNEVTHWMPLPSVPSEVSL